MRAYAAGATAVALALRCGNRFHPRRGINRRTQHGGRGHAAAVNRPRAPRPRPRSSEVQR
ncbi:hypothetical protein [Lysobacter gummosus]|uniref:hypothetical protein n=1 Tax=Lysobacter gummosus TaxID=262324 RepID=UPI00362C5321